MKTRKTLEITFPSCISASLFIWDGCTRGCTVSRHGRDNVLLVEVQRRTERRDMACTARWIYGATTRTLVR